jgi:hypothetical protein
VLSRVCLHEVEVTDQVCKNEELAGAAAEGPHRQLRFRALSMWCIGFLLRPGAGDPRGGEDLDELPSEGVAACCLQVPDENAVA